MASTPAGQLAEFVRTRRGRVRPADLGLEPGGRRKVTGLRREELALLAGVSADYLQRIEQGRDVRPSDEVLDALAKALALTEDETRYLLELGQGARRPAAAPRRRVPERVPASTRNLLDLMACPAMVLSSHLDILAWNALGGSLLGGLEQASAEERNMLRAVFLHPESRHVCPDWEQSAIEYIGMFRAAVATDPDHPRAKELVGELTLRSPDFPRLWARHDVRQKTSGSKRFAHPRIGSVLLDWDAYPLPGSPGPVMVTYTAAPGSADADRLALLSTLVNTPR
ncbi:transcriptional regulator with XRE-family HTH domain [Crossiella equi]|uniref:Transcriptional regulator with XRE-family HTH domain n=1 Tax=Crossiella equi TaxID=130796 RepID=A0ABS5A5L2_9PSEU|nr:helix-turn-helix transcriptional regulator [Crossiella equi]MBP2471890.1 transcriptional regulator with XRE-family HTH domain [Crossiella equi]